MELYFLRSSEQKIASDMLRYAYRLDEIGKNAEDFDTLRIYTKAYGLTRRDLGLYALKEHKVAGATWIRLLSEENGANAFVDDMTPVLTIAVKPEFRGEGVGSAMLGQLLLEAASLFEQISVSVLKESKAVRFYESFGFVKVDGSESKSPVDGAEVFTMLKKLDYKEVVRPTDGYDASKWMD